MFQRIFLYYFPFTTELFQPSEGSFKNDITGGKGEEFAKNNDH